MLYTRAWAMTAAYWSSLSTEVEEGACGGEPVVSDILGDGVALVGRIIKSNKGAT